MTQIPPPANIVTFLIFWRRNCLLSKSSTFYPMAISVADTLVLIFIVVLEITVKFYHEVLISSEMSREPWCRLRDIFSYGAYNTSTWLVVVFTAERFIAIHTWAIKTKLCTPRSALAAITTILLLSHLMAIPYYWFNVSVYDHNQTKWACIYKPEAPHGYVHALVGAQTLVAYVLPFLIILTLNGLTLRQISLSNRVHVLTAANLTSGAYRVTPLLRSRKRKSVVLLVTVSMSFVLLSVTRAITQIIIRTTFFYGQDRNDCNLQINVAADIGSMLSLSNAAINTYLYACTQAKFRQPEFKLYYPEEK
ncbi:probable G-protein coupled receptor 139 [Oncorhynchus kisutch]|uniref:probable G-protein coupled receptor 139 n=1 Tax=Oncorhynchus kisutch TaxID=8019 RepID=UPI00099FEB40|nr:probable G-protein coupled receptor 139 [Oncorhynchus kisutch]